MIPSIRTYEQDMRIHRLSVGESINGYCRQIMQNARMHDVALCRGTDAEKLDELYPSLKQCRQYSWEWEQALQKEDLLLHDAIYEKLHYLPNNVDEVGSMTLDQLIELCADIISWSKIQSSDALDILDDVCTRGKIDSQLHMILENTICDMDVSLKAGGGNQ